MGGKDAKVGEDAIVQLFRNNIDCRTADSSKAMFVGASNPSSLIIVNNYALGDYTLRVTNLNGKFYSYCQPFTLSFDDSKSNYILNASLVLRSDEQGSGVVVLENQFLPGSEDQLAATLGMSVIFNDDKECLVATYNRRCADFKYIKTSFAQAISFEHTYIRYHLFFVSKLPFSQAEQTLLERSRLSSLQTENSNKLSVDNSVFIQKDLILKVYAPGSEYEIASYSPPIYSST